MVCVGGRRSSRLRATAAAVAHSTSDTFGGNASTYRGSARLVYSDPYSNERRANSSCISGTDSAGAIADTSTDECAIKPNTGSDSDTAHGSAPDK